jgi:hypothetical protein
MGMIFSGILRLDRLKVVYDILMRWGVGMMYDSAGVCVVVVLVLLLLLLLLLLLSFSL